MRCELCDEPRQLPSEKQQRQPKERVAQQPVQAPHDHQANEEGQNLDDKQGPNHQNQIDHGGQARPKNDHGFAGLGPPDQEGDHRCDKQQCQEGLHGDMLTT